MEPRAHHVLIGLFTVAIVCAALLFALWLGKSYKDVELRYYTVIFNETVRGLSRGSAVQYSGIKVGDITDLSLDPQDPRKVRAHIRVEGNIPITQDTKAKLALTGITGTSVIELSGGTPGSPPLVGQNGKEPVIVATPSSLAQLLANGDNLMANLSELIINAKAFLSAENAQRLGKTLESLQEVANAMAGEKDNVDAMLKTLATASQQATTALRQATELMRNTDNLVKNQGARTLDSAQQAMASLEEASSNINEILRKNKSAINGGMQGLNEIGPTLQELRNTLASMRNVTRRLEENPTNYLLGREKMQEFQP
ncbi:MlaD family protein [Eoetvoesiella caeni]|uniref:Phospholipid/cholesterol/gamma-HCH transport system substrate-binding protein n=1 Tax=Eoetvoesiella caeni TaxID=645616 RepID=A0A366HC57_9BURK|nr:MlaD family protein [Eoetvoesiella caeni]MCI2809165.1 MCE family protein [Eoetvoesiella caeni]NYT54307.1 MCE family protein [Eoetvoesiella caeni]RBP39508.1 phospholipid/cholesterol/gamma-HCH transport system substrate-binding protein [Eoetvoesiella caeni]